MHNCLDQLEMLQVQLHTVVPTVHKIYLTHCCWKICICEASTKKDYLAILNCILKKLLASPENGKASQQTFLPYTNNYVKSAMKPFQNKKNI